MDNDSDEEPWKFSATDFLSDSEEASMSNILEFPEEVLSAFKTNQPPPEVAVEKALTLREHPAALISEFDAKLADLDAQVKELEKEKNELEKVALPHRRKLQICDTVLAPIRHVPFDIIREIARSTLPDYPTATTKDAPLSLCQVSSAWRTAALSIPELWTTLYISLKDVLSISRYKRRVIQWFERAKRRPVSLFIYFDFPVTHMETAKQAYGIFLRRIRSHVSQIQHLGVSAETLRDILPCFKDAGWALDGLKTLELQDKEFASLDWATFGTRPEPDVVLPSMDVFKSAASLRSLIIEGDFYMRTGANPLIPWAQLTVVKLTEWLRDGDWVQIMLLCPQIVLGDFQIAAEEVPEVVAPKPVLEHLEELHLLLFDNSISAIDLLNLFLLPKLCMVNLRHENIDDGATSLFPAKEVSALQTIERFYFEDVWKKTTPLYVVEMITEMSNLRELELTDVVPGPTYQTLFEAMSFNTMAPILPMLSSLYVVAPKKLTDWSNFVEMVRSRIFNVPAGCQPLSEVRVVIQQSWNRKMRRKVIPAIAGLKESLRACKEAGMRLSIGDNHDAIYSRRPAVVGPRWYPH
ncbi:hypothetical protein NLJ89_g8949 [Agrocybe chaxingu]|uniref:F-box domain-containing protein n=1 Tax=Agrocybe chaxingu TaxID=84603 RepID=A0A9W8MSB0_9AGAR|nr:hypothetical protein NLJ89_g8949 [Agrocybe chaxingu]